VTAERRPARRIAPLVPEGAAARPDDLKSADDRIKEIALSFLPRLSAVIRVSRNYDSDNQVFVQQLDGLLECVAPLLEESGEAVFVALQDDLYLNGVRVPVRTGNVRFHKHVLGEFLKRRIAGLKIVQGAETRELSVLFRLLREPEVYNGPELLSACLANGADRIAPVIHASTDAPDDSFEYDALWDGGSDEAPVHGGGWGGSGPGDAYGLRGDNAADAGPGDGSGGDASVGYAAPRGAARKGYSAAVQGARSLLTTTSLQNGMELRHAKRVVQPLVDGAFSEAPVVVGLGTLSHHDEYTYAHAVNVTLVAVSMGHFLELDRRALADLGVAALLHDVGKQAVAEQVKHPIDHFDTHDWEAVRRHPLEGAKLIARSTTLNSTTLRCMHVALEHHLSPGDNGYPEMGERWRPSILSRLVSVADCFVSLQTHRSQRGSMVTPYMALGMMLGPLKPRFDPAMLWALVQTLGYYPPGQLVELDDGSIAAVLAPNLNDLARPHVRIVVDANRTSIAGDPVELRPIPADRSVKRALPAEEYPQDPGTPEPDAAA
jgi:HD-GYP domain-containing protein (c-di-GMP phosphodiesterase class II)